jgi:ubiquinone/menaquinone biosynthesis C-methylase UbiE
MYTEMAGEILREKEFQKLLDISTGPGFMPIELALNCKDCSITGMDESPDMVRIAEANATASHVRNTVNFVTGSVESLPFPGRYFDLVTCVNVLHHWENPVSAMEEIYHVLLPGGEFWIYDYRYETPQKVWDEARERLPIYLRLPFTIGPVGSWKASYSEREIRKMVSDTRFEMLSIEQKTFTLFEQSMPAFTLARLRKPAATTD